MPALLLRTSMSITLMTGKELGQIFCPHALERFAQVTARVHSLCTGCG
jgi:hypothetical protein